MRFYIGLYSDNQEYKIGNVNFVVGSSFQTMKIKENPTIADRFKRIIASDFVDLTDDKPPNIMAEEYVCSTAGKED